MNPGNLSDSRALRTNTPMMLHYLQKLIVQPLRPILHLLKDPTMRTSAEAGVDVIEMALNSASPGERGYFTLLKMDKSAPDSYDKEKQEKLWKKGIEWTKITQENTSLKSLLG
jgi:hypothetical protein